MTIADCGTVPIIIETDIVSTRKAVRDLATKIGFGPTDTTRIVTAASELARNVYKYAGQGVMHWKTLQENGRLGLELRFEDKGPGIQDIEAAMQEGHTTGGGLGMGLPGARRLMDELEIQSAVGEGTTVITRKWRR
jgi:serine/threonine-protein kinase RsbT